MAKIPKTIGKYQIESLIAKGGMGAVYKAEHPTLKRPVIIKKLTLYGKKDITERFKREARILMEFRHDHIVSIYDHFKEGSSYYLVMEYVDGISIEEMILNNRYVHSSLASYILLNTARALKYAHSKKVVHRDIKPANILISREGAIKLVDFGIASSEETQAEGLTIDGMTLGTPGYMAPEQFKDSRNVDLRADIYSLGVLAYEMVTGKKPFPGSYSPELMNKIQTGKYLAPEKIMPGIEPNLLRFIKKAMKTKKEKRYQDLDPVISLLEKTTKKWNCEGLKNSTASAANREEIKIPAREKPKREGVKITASSILTLVVLTAGIGIFHLGLYKGILYPEKYGKVVFSVKTPLDRPSLSPDAVSISIFYDDDKKIPPVEETPVIFLSKKEDSFSSLTSLPLFLPEGSYRVKITALQEVFWSSFNVHSSADSKGKGGEFVTYYRYDRGARSLLIIPQVRDAVTGENLLSKSTVLIKEGRMWKPLFDAENIMTGSVKIIKIQVPGYREKDFSLKVENS
ncbi:MAG: serine/threonine-protein kinase, partial [Spirochaetia bacterium]|nr:serine/threonine-protein kinase [Spirochaetia bacterium]